MQASYFRLICLSSAVLEARGDQARKQSSGKVCTLYTAIYNNVDAGFARYTMLSSNFLNQLNLLLFNRTVIWMLLRANSLAVRLKTARGTRRFHHPATEMPEYVPAVTLRIAPPTTEASAVEAM